MCSYFVFGHGIDCPKHPFNVLVALIFRTFCKDHIELLSEHLGRHDQSRFRRRATEEAGARAHPRHIDAAVAGPHVRF